MRRQEFRIGALVAVLLAVAVLPALAQRERPAGAGSTGSAEPRGGGGGGGGGAAGGGASGGGSMGSSSTPSSSGSSSAPTSTAPGHSSGSAAERAAPPRRSGDDGSIGHAVPRGSRGDGSTAASARPAGAQSAVANGDSSVPERAAVPAYSRPRDGRPVTGQAVERGSVYPGNGGGVTYYPGHYYYPYGFWGSGYGYGLGFLYYDPFWYGGYAPGYYGGYGYNGYGYGGYGYGGYGYGGSGGYSQSVLETGSLRLKIKPRNAQVFVDGYFVGEVDSFDGVFQKLGIESGGHKIEIKADGYEPAQFDVLVAPGETVTYKGELKRIQ